MDTTNIDSRSLLNAVEASKLLKIAVPTLYQWAKQRKIPHVRLGDRVLFCPDEIIAAARVPVDWEFANRNVGGGGGR